MTSETWLITGGAGYIGSHIADAFLAKNKEVIVYDLAQRGQSSRIDYLVKKHQREVPFFTGDIRDLEFMESLVNRYKPYGVIHTAALKSVAESIDKPTEYYDINCKGTSNVLDLLTKYKIKNLIFSSTAAVYGAPDNLIPVKESDLKNPISPYGTTKLEAENEVSSFLSKPGNNGTSLRFFNVIGASSKNLVDDSVANLVPIVMNKIIQGDAPVIFGVDFPTIDGTCVRDYVDVRDVAAAHLACAESITKLPPAMNVGTGSGASVRQIIDLVNEAIGSQDVIPLEADRRVGDPAFLCADVSLIKEVIGFKAKYSVRESIESLFSV
jgi:UDP-glucose 4-epimerase